MNYAETTIEWKPVSEYAGGRVLATNGLDIIIGRIDCDNDCINEGETLCGITAFALMDEILHEFQKSEDERIRKEIIKTVKLYGPKTGNPGLYNDMIIWLEKQGEKKSE